jgi:hypothetical protein
MKGTLILKSPRSFSFPDALRPPMDEDCRAVEITAVMKGDAPGGSGVLQHVEIGEVAVDECDVRQRPEVQYGAPPPSHGSSSWV